MQAHSSMVAACPLLLYDSTKMAPAVGLGHHRRCGIKVSTSIFLGKQSTFTTARPLRNHRATTGFSDTFSDTDSVIWLCGRRS